MPHPFRFGKKRMKMSFGRRVQKVQVVKKRRKRRGPKVTRLLKNKTTAALRYVDTITLNAGSAAIVKHTFSANGLFDPDITSTGHQPLMFDEYADLYDHYRVISSKIKVTPVNTVTANVIPSLYGVYLDNDVTLTYSLGTSIIEDKRNKGSWGMSSDTLTQSRSLRQGTKTASFNAKRYLSPEGADNAVIVSANPSTSGPFDAFYQIWSASILGNDPGAASFLVQIDYVVEFTGPLVVVPS